MSDNGEPLQDKIRRVADEFEKYIGADGLLNASALVDEIERLSTEVMSLRGLVRAVASETSIPMEEIEQSIDAVSGNQT